MEEGICAAIAAVRKLSLSIGIPQRLREINVREEDLHQLAINAFNDVWCITYFDRCDRCSKPC